MSIIAAMIDSREPDWVQALTFGNAMTAVTLLDAGDLWATTDDGALLCVERKTADDLLSSLKDGRLWPQLVGLRQRSPWAYLVITGKLQPGADGHAVTDRGPTGWAWSAVQGALLQAQELGVYVVQAASDQDYEATVVRLSARSRKSELVIEPAKTARVLSDGEQILAALPGVGMERVGALLAYTSSPAWAIHWLCDGDSRERVPGIGAGTKTAVRRALGLPDDLTLAVICKEEEDHGTQ